MHSFSNTMNFSQCFQQVVKNLSILQIYWEVAKDSKITHFMVPFDTTALYSAELN